MGLEAAIKRQNIAAEKVDQINAQIRALPTLSVYAIAVKLKVLAFDLDMDPIETENMAELEWDQERYLRLLREVEALAASQTTTA